MAKSTADDGSLKRLGGGRWQTRDERFTIEPQSGTWVVVDAEQTDDLGLPLVRGPFSSLGAAKGAIASARDAEPAVSPLAEQLATLRARNAAAPRKTEHRSGEGRPPTASPRPAKPELPPEPRWMRDLAPADHRRARRLIDQLTAAKAPDPEGLARRDIVGKVPAAAAFAIARALASLGPDAAPAAVARLLVHGRDADLDLRWRLVDGDDRPITLDVTPRDRG